MDAQRAFKEKYLFLCYTGFDKLKKWDAELVKRNNK